MSKKSSFFGNLNIDPKIRLLPTKIHNFWTFNKCPKIPSFLDTYLLIQKIHLLSTKIHNLVSKKSSFFGNLNIDPKIRILPTKIHNFWTLNKCPTNRLFLDTYLLIQKFNFCRLKFTIFGHFRLLPTKIHNFWTFIKFPKNRLFWTLIHWSKNSPFTD